MKDEIQMDNGDLACEKSTQKFREQELVKEKTKQRKEQQRRQAKGRGARKTLPFLFSQAFCRFKSILFKHSLLDRVFGIRS
ncbi:hypothetical protein SUGI_0489260 [Cryptomeria japonica]|nr:hypothetical protein SUGI_0489260 [Cryptomeria japonica]